MKFILDTMLKKSIDDYDEDMRKYKETNPSDPISWNAEIIKNLIDAEDGMVLYGGRYTGKKAFSEYIGMQKVLEDFGVSCETPIETLYYILSNYQKVICKCTGGLLSHVYHDADTIIAAICDKQSEDEETFREVGMPYPEKIM